MYSNDFRDRNNTHNSENGRDRLVDRQIKFTKKRIVIITIAITGNIGGGGRGAKKCKHILRARYEWKV